MLGFSSAGLRRKPFRFPLTRKERSSSEPGKRARIAMLIYEYKLDGNPQQYQAIDEAIRIVQFIRNKSLRKWMDGRSVSKNDLHCSRAVMARDDSFASVLISQPPQPARDRARG